VTISLGVDIGGTGIKGALVNTPTGELSGPRIKYPTPVGSRPADVVATVRQIVDESGATAGCPVGVCFPAPVREGVTLSAANVSDEWIGFPAERVFADALGREVHFVNDADAAGYAETRVGAARNIHGLVIVITLGTGIGTALISDGHLVPNAELGHLELEGEDAETRASNAAREREGLDYVAWGTRLSRYFSHLEMLFSPALFVIGGGISREYAEFFPFIQISTPLAPAQLFNNAGIVGSALLAGQTR
jgi:polyphosphate glucokinase